MRMRHCGSVLLLAGLIWGCGGGSGVGPEELLRQEEKLRDRLPVDWENYKNGDYDAAIEFFTSTLERAETYEGPEATLNQIKSEAHNGIGWAFFRKQDLKAASTSFQQATTLNRRNADAWVGYSGVALARRMFSDAIQYAMQALSVDNEYASYLRLDDSERQVGHDNFDTRHVRMILAESYFQIGRYSAIDRPDPGNASAQLRMIDEDFTFRDPGQLLLEMSRLSIELQAEQGIGF